MSVKRETTSMETTPTAPTSSPADYFELRVWAEMFDDAQKALIAANNRAKRGGVDSLIYAAYIVKLEEAEHQCRLSLGRAYRRIVSPEVIAWQESSAGIGEHLLARLIGHIGHPVHATPQYWVGKGPTRGQSPLDAQSTNAAGGKFSKKSKSSGSGHGSGDIQEIDAAAGRTLEDGAPFDRTIAQLWAYCGLGDPTRKRRTGMSADDAMALGKPLPKSILYLLAEACKKLMGTGNKPVSPYRLVYDARRKVTADRVHADVCVRCGPSGRPAQPGSPWSGAHQEADALRVMSKEILRDLWLVAAGQQAKFGGDQSSYDTHTGRVPADTSSSTKVRRQAKVATTTNDLPPAADSSDGGKKKTIQRSSPKKRASSSPAVALSAGNTKVRRQAILHATPNSEAPAADSSDGGKKRTRSNPSTIDASSSSPAVASSASKPKVRRQAIQHAAPMSHAPVADVSTRTCQGCGEQFEVPRRPGRPPAYCSLDCRTGLRVAAA